MATDRIDVVEPRGSVIVSPLSPSPTSGKFHRWTRAPCSRAGDNSLTIARRRARRAPEALPAARLLTSPCSREGNCSNALGRAHFATVREHPAS
jgi:hypothetical protein